VAALVVRSPAFEHGARIPARYTCDGEDVSPPLEWSGAPEGTRSYALIVEDPDAPGGTWTHWVAWNVRATALAAATAKDPELQSGVRQGRNSWGRAGWGGPCPPSGTHRYVFRVHALDSALELPDRTDAQALRGAMRGRVLAEGELLGTYSRGAG
jgi:hypothetical protein